ncbi:GBA [Mytilus coruscus]|uniref:Glucosylceramidase n=1 Tax=Mytilus coruscus TaxID=42192 RepID=A0A6J8BMT9_MYTCO|nr:GBA [Mytilus coruscus]
MENTDYIYDTNRVSYIRITMGGSDFQAVPPYTCDYMSNGETDFQMKHFSIQKDREFFIPIIKEALSLYPSLKIVATPWSPPAWIKSTNTLYGAYKAEGIDINAITIQNEPRHQASGYPTTSMTMSWQIQRDLIKWHMGPLFRQINVNTKILILNHNWDLQGYPGNILRDNDAKQYVLGVAWHCYAGDKSEPERLHSKFSNIDQYFTECSGYAGSPNFKGNLVWNFDNLFLHQPRVWAKTVLLWNIALDQNHDPTVQVQCCKDCRCVVTVYSESDRYQKEVEYYIIGHMTKVVKTQDVRIDSTDNVNGLRSVAFENPLGTIAVVVLNTQDQNEQFALNFNGVRYSYNLPGKSVASFLYSP